MQRFLQSRGEREGHPAAPGAVQGAEEPRQPGSPQRAALQGTGREKAGFRGVKAPARQQPGVLYYLDKGYLLPSALAAGMCCRGK